jgi:hypothetical protein
MKKIKIERNTLGDTRTATRIPTFYEFVDSNNSHVKDVSKMMDNIADEIRMSGRRHDYTKTNDPEKSLFYRELCATIEGKMDSFVDGEWYPMHCKTERHHLNEHCPEDVNLIDVLEMICDCVCAGMARSGSVYPISISDDVLRKALDNTVQMCIDAVEIVE